MNNPLTNKMVLRAIGIIIFILIVIELDLTKTTEILSETKLTYCLAGLALFIPHLFLKVYRWSRILYFQKIRIRFKKLIHPYIGSYGLGIITPWKVGETTRIFYLRSKKVPLGTASFSALIDRLIDVSFFMLIGVLSMFFLFSYFKSYLIGVTLAIVLVIMGGILLIKFRHKLFKFATKFIIHKKIRKKTEITIQEIWAEFKKFRFMAYVELFLITALSWLFFYFEVYLFSMALNIPLTLWHVIILVSIASIVNMLPITVSGIGTRDATFAFLFGIFGFATEQAIALSLLILFMWVVNALFCLVFWWERPIQIKNP